MVRGKCPYIFPPRILRNLWTRLPELWGLHAEAFLCMSIIFSHFHVKMTPLRANHMLSLLVRPPRVNVIGAVNCDSNRWGPNEPLKWFSLIPGERDCCLFKTQVRTRHRGSTIQSASSELGVQSRPKTIATALFIGRFQ